MYEILQAIKAKDLGPAIEYLPLCSFHARPPPSLRIWWLTGRWADKKRAQLEQRSSDLSFDLHRLQFIKLFTAKDPHPAPQALAYAQANFPSFQQRHLTGIFPNVPFHPQNPSPRPSFLSPISVDCTPALTSQKSPA